MRLLWKERSSEFDICHNSNVATTWESNTKQVICFSLQSLWDNEKKYFWRSCCAANSRAGLDISFTFQYFSQAKTLVLYIFRIETLCYCIFYYRNKIIESKSRSFHAKRYFDNFEKQYTPANIKFSTCMGNGWGTCTARDTFPDQCDVSISISYFDSILWR